MKSTISRRVSVDATHQGGHILHKALAPNSAVPRRRGSRLLSGLLFIVAAGGVMMDAYGDESPRDDPFSPYNFNSVDPGTRQREPKNPGANQKVQAVVGKKLLLPVTPSSQCSSELIYEVDVYLGCRIKLSSKQKNARVVDFTFYELSEYECLHFCEIWGTIAR